MYLERPNEATHKCGKGGGKISLKVIVTIFSSGCVQIGFGVLIIDNICNFLVLVIPISKFASPFKGANSLFKSANSLFKGAIRSLRVPNYSCPKFLRIF